MANSLAISHVIRLPFHLSKHQISEPYTTQRYLIDKYRIFISHDHEWTPNIRTVYMARKVIKVWFDIAKFDR